MYHFFYQEKFEKDKSFSYKTKCYTTKKFYVNTNTTCVNVVTTDNESISP